MAKRFKFIENPYMPSDRIAMFIEFDSKYIVFGIKFNEAWQQLAETEDDIICLFHPSVPDSSIGKLINDLRDQGHSVEITRRLKHGTD